MFLKNILNLSRLSIKYFQSSYWGDHDWEMGDADDSRARKAYEALLRVSLLQPSSPKYQGFADNVKEMALKNYNYTFGEGEEVRFEFEVNSIVFKFS